MLTGISDGGFDTKQLNIIYYQNINQMILMDILQQSLIHIHCKPLYLKCLDERLRLFSNIYIKYLYRFKSCKKIITRKTSLQKALLVTFPHTLPSPPMFLNLDPTNDVFTVGDTLVS